jgi:hypothetical protein
MMPASYTNMPDPDFFRGNYQSTAMQNSTGLTPSSPAVPAVPQNGWISRDKPNNNILKKWGADQTIPRDAFLDEGMADVPAVEPDEYKPREPGVIIQPPPKVEFRDSYH